MSIACKVRDYLEREGVNYELIRHPPTLSSQRTAEAMHVPGERIAKSVMLGDEYGYVLAVVPATHRVEPQLLQRLLRRDLTLVPEPELARVFDDCVLGAIPPVGEAYGVQVLVEESLAELPEVYFEAGDHTDMVHVQGADFRAMMARAEHGHISEHV